MYAHKTTITVPESRHVELDLASEAPPRVRMWLLRSMVAAACLAVFSPASPSNRFWSAINAVARADSLKPDAALGRRCGRPCSEVLRESTSKLSTTKP